ncbi:type II toxin-antitoxin system HicB family antitoxin [Cupriavidus sp. CuC1]|uniref:type II toxin-antitoxin system HicB family antitoxin n=1 Tax=Cupriavidus sp. CuC1 TaxID=3373131 RepID=UPI0037D8BA4C
MSDMLQYGNYYGSVEYSAADRCFIGKLEFIDDIIIFDGTSVPELEAAFRDAVDSYIVFCELREKESCTAYEGGIKIRIGSELHRKAAVSAKKNGKSLNDLVKYAIEKVLYENPESHG